MVISKGAPISLTLGSLFLKSSSSHKNSSKSARDKSSTSWGKVGRLQRSECLNILLASFKHNMVSYGWKILHIPALNHDFIEFFGQPRRGRETITPVYHCDHLCKINNTMPYMYRDKIRLSYLHNNIVPRDYCNFQMVCVQDSKSHTWHTQSSTHHWQWSTSCSV